MSLDIGDAIGDGIQRSLTYTGGVLMGLLFVYQLVYLGSMNAVMRAVLPAEIQESGQFAFAFPIPTALAGSIVVVGMLAGVALYLVASRALTRPHSELHTLPTALFTRRIGRALLSAIGASIVTMVAITIGFVFLVIPGIFLAISFIFVVFAIGVEDERALDSLRRSWALASGNRWSLLAVFLVVAVITAVGSAIGSAISFIDPVAGQVLTVALTSVFAVISYGIFADAFLQLRSNGRRETGESPTITDQNPDTEAR